MRKNSFTIRFSPGKTRVAAEGGLEREDECGGVESAEDKCVYVLFPVALKETLLISRVT